jgi:hypothetical protein
VPSLGNDDPTVPGVVPSVDPDDPAVPCVDDETFGVPLDISDAVVAMELVG